MTKQEFLTQLQNGLSGLPQSGVDERVSFYGEMIDDRVEEGMSEEEAVAGIGAVDDVISQTVGEMTPAKPIEPSVIPRRTLPLWQLILIILGFPLWFSLLAAAAAVILSLYVVIWALIISLWAFELSAAVGVFACAACVVILWASGKLLPGLAMLGAALFLAGLSILLFFACVGISKETVILTKKAVLSLGRRFIRRENSK